MGNSLATDKGTLYVVATPIGNREDITLRALSILKSVDLILAEDTRHSAQLLTSLGIKNNISSLHSFNEHDKSKLIIEKLCAGKSIALISDAGTPLICDPGFPLVKLARQYGVVVSPIPGPCALIAALSAAGVPCDSFLFIGFLPAKQKARLEKLNSLKEEEHTLIFYESTHRISDCLADLALVYGPSIEIVLCKELTKTFERFIAGTVVEVIEWLKIDSNHLKGEFALIIPQGTKVKEQGDDERVLQILLDSLPLKQAIDIAVKLTNSNKNQLYKLALTLKNP